MNRYIEKLKKYLSERPIQYSYDNVGSLLELLSHCYLEDNPIENAVIYYQFQQLDDILKKLTISENNEIFQITCTLCREHTRRAFSEGLHTGIRLAFEMESDRHACR